MSCADVCIDHDYATDDNDFFVERMVAARKEHRCCECVGAIGVGERYERASGKSDGRIWSTATCAVCAEIRDAFVCGSWIYGRLWVSIEEEMFPIWDEYGPLDCLAKLKTVEARQKCRDRYHEWQQETR